MLFRSVGEHGQVLELKAAVRLPRKGDHHFEFEVTHAGFSLQLGVKGCRQQREGADQLQPSAPFAMAQRSERPG